MQEKRYCSLEKTQGACVRGVTKVLNAQGPGKGCFSRRRVSSGSGSSSNRDRRKDAAEQQLRNVAAPADIYVSAHCRRLEIDLATGGWSWRQLRHKPERAEYCNEATMTPDEPRAHNCVRKHDRLHAERSAGRDNKSNTYTYIQARLNKNARVQRNAGVRACKRYYPLEKKQAVQKHKSLGNLRKSTTRLIVNGPKPPSEA